MAAAAAHHLDIGVLSGLGARAAPVAPLKSRLVMSFPLQSNLLLLEIVWLHITCLFFDKHKSS